MQLELSKFNTSHYSLLANTVFATYIRDERTVIFCDPDPVLNFQNSVQAQPQSKLFFEIKSPSPNKVQKINKMQRFNNKYHALLVHLRSPNPVLTLNL